MTPVNAVVVEVLSEPCLNDEYAHEGIIWWEVDVKFESCGRLSRRTLILDTEEEARSVTIGYQFLV